MSKVWKKVEKFVVTIELEGSEISDFQTAFGVMKVLASDVEQGLAMLNDNIETLEIIYEKFMEFFKRAKVKVSEISDYLLCERYFEELLTKAKEAVKMKQIKTENTSKKKRQTKKEKGESDEV